MSEDFSYLNQLRYLFWANELSRNNMKYKLISFNYYVIPFTSLVLISSFNAIDNHLLESDFHSHHCSHIPPSPHQVFNLSLISIQSKHSFLNSLIPFLLNLMYFAIRFELILNWFTTNWWVNESVHRMIQYWCFS